MPNSARSREKSRRSRRSLILVPALLTALLSPLLPTDTALAATPPPATAQADPTPEPPATTAPGPDPTTDPSPTTDPTVDPSPNPTEPTVDPCPALPLAPFGDPGDAVGHAALAPGESACFTVTVEKPGPHRVLVEGGASSLTFSSGGTRVACPELQGSPCQLAVGTYTLDLARAGLIGGEVRVAVVPLVAGPGCTDPAGTAFGTDPTTGTSSGELGIVCHPFAAQAGELINTSLRPAESANINAWITDDTGKWLCSVGYDCVLPVGVGGYRVLAHLSPSGGTYPVPYTLRVRQVSHPVGCSVVGVSAYGSAPTEISPPAECKTFTPATSGAYQVEAVEASGALSTIKIYAPTGRICEDQASCLLTAGVTYTLITDGTVRILDPRSTEGCTNDAQLGRTLRSSFSVPGEVDCLNLPVPQGAHVVTLTGYAPGKRGTDPEVTLVDATGATPCAGASEYVLSTCVLGGTAPYRAIVRNGTTDPSTGAYALAFHRTDAASGCRTFLAGDFTAASAPMTVSTGGDAFSDCLTIPADAHSARELITLRKVAGDSDGELAVFDQNGGRACLDPDSYESVPLEACPLTPGRAYTALVHGTDTTAEFALTRRDVTATARGCVDTPATAVGGPSVAGVLTAPGTFVCHLVTTTDSRDTLHLNVRDTSYLSAWPVGVYQANGAEACADLPSGCAVTGSIRYQAVVEVREGTAGAPAYRVDALRIATAAGPAPECVKVPNVSYGFGPLVATLSEQKTALCVTLPTMSSDRFAMTQTPATSLAQTPTPRLYTLSDRRNGCDRQYSEYYECTVPQPEDEWYRVSLPSVLVIGMPSAPTQSSVAVRATFTCNSTWMCGPEERTVGTVTPGTVGAGKITLRVTGAALHEKDVVEVSGGTYRARSTTVSVAPDRRSMDVALDLTNAPRTALGLKVVTHDGSTYDRGRVTVVAPLRATAAPGITGTAVIGGKVTAKAGTWTPAADSYAYQWRADGVAIAGATASTYTLPSTLFGKQLSVAVTARKAGHPVVTAVSGYLVVKGLAPKPTKVPYISGTTRVGSKVSAVVGTWSPAPASYAYQWRANGVAIAGATGSSYTLPASVLGKKLTVTVTAHRTGHLSGSHTTVGYTVAYGSAPKATRAPYVTGTVKVGRTLSLNRGTWTPAPTSYAYQWYANGRAISGATKTWFTPTKAQRGTRITVKVTAYRTGHYAGVAWTRSTGAVAG
ncbi:hypothetical protein OG462_25495 [Streptomyces sp. NBC_01077]|uniref:hypothetical protein n=1 Tax=Streptomyces sp. NBC_01077 TaxID=2903746 RepID=UPI00386FFFCA|nr:hypothetical protein OG462_25495 [Streptomyces sp. NBC_01077]